MRSCSELLRVRTLIFASGGYAIQLITPMFKEIASGKTQLEIIIDVPYLPE